MDAMDVHTKTLIANIERLSEANREVIHSTETISAASEEVASNSNETYESQKTNMETLETVVEITNQLKILTEKL